MPLWKRQTAEVPGPIVMRIEANWGKENLAAGLIVRSVPPFGAGLQNLAQLVGHQGVKFSDRAGSDQFAARRTRISRARLSMARILSAAGGGTSGTAMASWQESSMAVRVSPNSLRICSSTARRA